VDETARRAAGFYAGFDRRVEEEASMLRTLHTSIVVGDIPPLAFAAAARADVPSVALANFTWDWIYGAYPEFERTAPGVLTRIRDAYATATIALRLPLHGGFEPMLRVTRDIPLIARQSVRDRDETRCLLKLEQGLPVVLASFGSHGSRLPFAEIAREGRFTLVTTDLERAGGAASDASGHLREVSSAELRAHGVRYEDLVAASDVVVSKPGYGIVSECIANGAALLYTSRRRFIEQDVLVREMPGVLRCRPIDADALRAGNWGDAIDALLRQPAPPERMALDGAEVAARTISALAAGA
jgi:L-arabinokinase